MAYYDISEVFQIIEEEMIASMSRNLKRHLKTEKEEGLNYTMWQAEQLAALQNFKKDNKKLFTKYFSTINSQIEDVLKKANATGLMTQEANILEAIQGGFKLYDYESSGSVRGSFFKINDRKLNALIKATKSDMTKAETAMLRTANDEYRKIVFNAQAFYNTGAGTLSQCVDMATKDFLAKGITCIEYANGARVGIDVYSRMALRTAQTRAYLTGEATKRDEWGVNTVIVNKRGVACPMCLQWVGKVYYDDVWGSSPIPTVPKYPRLSEAVAGGLYHPNCKDIHTTYFEGINTPPQPMTQKQIDEANRVYNLEQRQRYNERQIRKYKRLWSGSVDPENALRYKEKMHEWQNHQKEFVAVNSDVLKRRPELEKIFQLPDNLQFGHNSYVPELNPDDIMNQAVDAAATELLEKAKAAEPQITADLQDIVKGTNGKLEGLDFRLKGHDSLARKIKSDVLNGEALDDVKGHLYDLVRYTECSSGKTLVEDYITTVNKLEAKGYKVLRVKNTLGKKDVAYRGINTVIESPDGYKFELQFHTPESLETKEKVHKLYEKQRVDGISKKEYDKLDKEMREMSNSIPDPDNIDAVKSFDTFKGEEPVEAKIDPCANGHTYVETIIKQPDCDTPGKKLLKCSVCGDEQTEEIPPLGHDIRITVYDPTCTTEGYTIKWCTRCSHREKTDIKPALGHDWGDWVITRQPTTALYGRKQAICKRCGEKKYTTIPKLKATSPTQQIKALEDSISQLDTEIDILNQNSYSGIWKDSVTVSDYSAKKSAIAAKKQYFLDKLAAGDTTKDWQQLIDLTDEFEIRGKEYETLLAQRQKNRDALDLLRPPSTSGPFTPDAYSKARKDAAVWTTDKSFVDSKVRDKTGQLWRNASSAQRSAAYKYTSGSGSFNRPLRGYQGSWSNYKGPGKVDLDWEGSGKAIDELTKLIDQSTYDVDMWLQRGVTGDGATSFLGLNPGDLSRLSQTELEKRLLGVVREDLAFMSTGAAKGQGFSGDLILNIYAPKGTKMLYCEPFSAYGNGYGASWNGISKQGSFGSEFEMLIQRGTKYKITKVEKTGWRTYVDVEVVSQR